MTKKKVAQVGNSTLLNNLESGFQLNDINENNNKPITKEVSVSSPKRDEERGGNKHSEIPESFNFLMLKTESKSSKQVYIDEKGRKNLEKLSFILGVDMRQLNTNIVNMFFDQNKDIMNELVKQKNGILMTGFYIIIGSGIIFYILLYIKYGNDLFVFNNEDNTPISKEKIDDEPIVKKENNDFVKIIAKNKHNINNLSILAKNKENEVSVRSAEIDVNNVVIEVDDVRNEKNDFVDVDNILAILDEQSQNIKQDDVLEDLLKDSGIDLKD